MSNEHVEASLEATVAAPPPAEVALVDELLEMAGVRQEDEQYLSVRTGLGILFERLMDGAKAPVQIDRILLDAMIVELTEKMSRQIDEILHHPTFQGLESAWRGLNFTVSRTDFRENIGIAFVNVSKDDLLMDFEDAPEITKCGLFRTVYSGEYGVFGGQPYGLLVANYEFEPSPRDMALLGQCAAVATMAHAPFIAAAGPRFFGLECFQTLPQLRDIASMFSGPQYTKWRAYRDSDDARYVGLCLPRFLLRLPYGAETVRVKAFDYEESVLGEHDRYLWGNAAFAFASRVAASFARYRWCPNIIGPSGGGAVDDLPLHQYQAMGEIQSKIPTEIMVTERREWELSEQGFISLTYRRETEGGCFFSANSTQLPKTFGISEEGKRAELNYRLGTQLPYLFVTCRLAHYLKVIQREQVGSWKEREDLERELNKWIMQYVADMEVVSPGVRARRPLRQAKITVAEAGGHAGWYKIDLHVRPHFKHMGATFSLGLVGRLDRE